MYLYRSLTTHHPHSAALGTCTSTYVARVAHTCGHALDGEEGHAAGQVPLPSCRAGSYLVRCLVARWACYCSAVRSHVRLHAPFPLAQAGAVTFHRRAPCAIGTVRAWHAHEPHCCAAQHCRKNKASGHPWPVHSLCPMCTAGALGCASAARTVTHKHPFQSSVRVSRQHKRRKEWRRRSFGPSPRCPSVFAVPACHRSGRAAAGQGVLCLVRATWEARAASNGMTRQAD